MSEGLEDSASGGPFDRAAALDAIPQDVTVWPDVDLAALDPALDPETEERRCIATKRAGGRCTVRPVHGGLLCGAHSGLLDPREGAQARAEKLREGRVTAEERSRLAALGTRGVIREALADSAADLREAVRVLARAAGQGDLQAAKALPAYFNQGYGLPTETVEVRTPTRSADLAAMGTDELVDFVAQQRAKRSQAA